jgi:hypothetical protein
VKQVRKRNALFQKMLPQRNRHSGSQQEHQNKNCSTETAFIFVQSIIVH